MKEEFPLPEGQTYPLMHDHEDNHHCVSAFQRILPRIADGDHGRATRATLPKTSQRQDHDCKGKAVMPEYRPRAPSGSKAAKPGRGSHTDLIIDAEELTVTSSVKNLLGKIRQPVEPVKNLIRMPLQLIESIKGAVGKPSQPTKPVEDLAGKVRRPIEPKTQWCPSGLSKSQRRRLQRLRTAELHEATLEAARDKAFNEL